MAPALNSSVRDRSVAVSSGSVNSGALSPALIMIVPPALHRSPGLALRGAILWHRPPLLLIFRALLGGSSSVGRASRSQCEGRGFDPLLLHHIRGRSPWAPAAGSAPR